MFLSSVFVAWFLQTSMAAQITVNPDLYTFKFTQSTASFQVWLRLCDFSSFLVVDDPSNQAYQRHYHQCACSHWKHSVHQLRSWRIGVLPDHRCTNFCRYVGLCHSHKFSFYDCVLLHFCWTWCRKLVWSCSSNFFTSVCLGTRNLQGHWLHNSLDLWRLRHSFLFHSHRHLDDCLRPRHNLWKNDLHDDHHSYTTRWIGHRNSR